MDAAAIVALVVIVVLLLTGAAYGLHALHAGARGALRASRHTARKLAPLMLDSVQAIVSWVDDAVRSDLRPQLAADGTITLLFSDIQGSTKLNVQLGDERWLALIDVHDKLAHALARQHDGKVIKSQGDGHMIAFRNPADAVRYAIAFQQQLPDTPSVDVALPVRIGIHTGEAMSQKGDFFGANVAFAARVSQQARGNEILVSAAVKDRTEGTVDATFLRGQRYTLRGIPGRHRLHEIDWKQSAPTV